MKNVGIGYPLTQRASDVTLRATRSFPAETAEVVMRQFTDPANWEGVHFESVDVGAQCKAKQYVFAGYHYCTKGEAQLAQLLSEFSVPFTQNVPFGLFTPESESRRFVPDFVFDRKAYIWHGRNRPVLIHGIEAKGKTRNGDFSPRALENVRLLQEQRGIRILLLSNSQIKQYFHNHRLPLKPLEPTDA